LRRSSFWTAKNAYVPRNVFGRFENGGASKGASDRVVRVGALQARYVASPAPDSHPYCLCERKAAATAEEKGNTNAAFWLNGKGKAGKAQQTQTFPPKGRAKAGAEASSLLAFIDWWQRLK
jgi:hypothetical protein